MDRKRFVEDIARRLQCDAARAEGVAFAVLQNLRDRITPQEAAHVAAQLPAGLRALWEDNDRAGRRVDRIHRAEFLGRVRKLGGLPTDDEAERGVRAVFASLQDLLGSPTGMQGEAWDVFSQLPKDLKPLWLEAHREPLGEAGAPSKRGS